MSTYKRYTVIGISDCTVCDNCGKSNLKMTVTLETERGEIVRFGSDCAAKSLRQDYMGKRYPITREAAISAGRAAKRGESFAKWSMQVAA